MPYRRLIVRAAALVAALVLAAPAVAGPKVVRVHGPAIVEFDGQAVYQSHCAVCHGPQGRGDGPAAAGLPEAIPDLTLIAVRDGRFVPIHVKGHVRETHAALQGMPNMGQILTHSCSSPVLGELASANLVRYIQSLQAAAQP